MNLGQTVLHHVWEKYSPCLYFGGRDERGWYVLDKYGYAREYVNEAEYVRRFKIWEKTPPTITRHSGVRFNRKDSQIMDNSNPADVRLIEALRKAIALEEAAKVAEQDAERTKAVARGAVNNARAAWDKYKEILLEIEGVYYRSRRA